jgi:hypothetical protein
MLSGSRYSLGGTSLSERARYPTKWGNLEPYSVSALPRLVEVRVVAQDCLHLVHHPLQGNIREQETPQKRFKFDSTGKQTGSALAVMRRHDTIRNPSDRLCEVEGVGEPDKSPMLETM